MTMPEERERPRPHGDPLADEVPGANREENQAQRQSDATPDPVGRESDMDNEDFGSEQKRKRQYDNGAELVSEID